MISKRNSVWWHGSPYQLIILKPGSTITQDRHLAEIFSHKPTIVSMEDDGSIRHNGTLPGFLYQIEDPIQDAALSPVPNSTMQPGLEWLTNRELKVKLVDQVEINLEEYLKTEEIKNLMKRIIK